MPGLAYKDDTVRRKRGPWWLDAIEQVACETAPALYDDVVVVTSGNDGRHGRGSLHGADKALDIRFTGMRPGGIKAPGITQLELAKAWAKRMRRALGSAFDVVVEGDHIHVEYDPK